MAYLGNTPTTQSFISGTDYFNGTGAQTAFTLTRTVASVNDIEAVVNNVVQQPNDAYNISGTTITFTSAPSAGTNNVYVRYLSTTTQAITPSQNTVGWNTLDSNVQGDLGISFKNRIMNGNMVIDQRNAGAAVNSTASSTVRPVDRFIVDNFGSGTVSCQRSTVAPVGFVNSLGLTVSVTDTPSAGDYLLLTQQIEGFNTADLMWGTANAKVVTLSFWVRSSVTGTYGASIRGGTSNYSYPINYSVNTANTWEYKTVTIPGTALVPFETENGRGFQIMWDLGSGSNFNGTLNTWQAGSFWRTSGCVNWVSNAAATFYITGVQLEVGTQATTFTLAGGSYGAELALCQRYFYLHVQGNSPSSQTIGTGMMYGASQAEAVLPFKVTMRTAPSLYVSNVSNSFSISNGSYDTTATTFAIFAATPNSALIFGTPASNGTNGAGVRISTGSASTSSTFLGFAAEL